MMDLWNIKNDNDDDDDESLNMLQSNFIHLINVIYFWIQVSSDAT